MWGRLTVLKSLLKQIARPQVWLSDAVHVLHVWNSGFWRKPIKKNIEEIARAGEVQKLGHFFHMVNPGSDPQQHIWFSKYHAEQRARNNPRAPPGVA